MKAEWGATEATWKPVPDSGAWLTQQAVFCLTTAHGALDIFRVVKGLEGKYEDCRKRATPFKTGNGVPFLSLSDQDMLACQDALPVPERKQRRMEVLRQALRGAEHG
jgi:hypothetical protein